MPLQSNASECMRQRRDFGTCGYAKTFTHLFACAANHNQRKAVHKRGGVLCQRGNPRENGVFP